MNLVQFNENVIKWADERGLLKAENVPKQMMKTMEELGELASAILKKNKTGIIDGIGDVFVCMTILAKQLGLSTEVCVNFAWNEIKDRTGRTIDGNFIKKDDLNE